MTLLSATEVLYAVACGEKLDNCLMILKDGVCIRVSTASGEIRSAFRLPERDAIAEALRQARGEV